MNRKNIEETVEQVVMDILADNEDSGIEIVDVEYVKEREWYLRVFLDKETGIELDDCQLISERLEESLDRLDLIKDQYYLEVSSPGLDRQLKKERDFVRHAGDVVEVKLYRPVDGVKNIVGTLVGLKDGVIYLKDVADAEKSGKKSGKGEKPAQPAQPKEMCLPWNEAASVRLHIDF